MGHRRPHCRQRTGSQLRTDGAKRPILPCCGALRPRNVEIIAPAAKIESMGAQGAARDVSRRHRLEPLPMLPILSELRWSVFHHERRSGHARIFQTSGKSASRARARQPAGGEDFRHVRKITAPWPRDFRAGRCGTVGPEGAAAITFLAATSLLSPCRCHRPATTKDRRRGPLATRLAQGAAPVRRCRKRGCKKRWRGPV